jgi:hypothetical protein
MNESQITAITNSTVTISTTGAFAGAPLESLSAAMFMLGNVNQTTPVEGAVVANVANGTNISTANINADNNDLIMFLASSSGSTSTWVPGSGFTERYDVQVGNHAYQVATQLRTSNGISMPSTVNSGLNRLQMLAFEVNVGTAPLPITLLLFDAQQVNQSVKLEWVSLSEKNNAYYTIEHATDGIHWKPIIIVDGALYSNQIIEYEAIHDLPAIGLNYYRLKQTDTDGQSEYFDAKIVEITLGKTQFTIFPNPANEGLSIDLNFYPTNAELEMYDNNGKLIWLQSIPNSNIEQRVKINTQQFPIGLYTIRIKNQFKLFESKNILIMH